MFTNELENATTLWERWDSPRESPYSNSRNRQCASSTTIIPHAPHYSDTTCCPLTASLLLYRSLWRLRRPGSVLDLLLLTADIMYGSIGAWFYRYVAGLELNGLEAIVIRPRMALDWTLMKRMQAEVVTVKGPLAVSYERSGDDGSVVEMEVIVPLNTRAVVVMEPLVKGGVCRTLWEGSNVVYESMHGSGVHERLLVSDVEGVHAVRVDADTGTVSVEVQGGGYRFRAAWTGVGE